MVDTTKDPFYWSTCGDSVFRLRCLPETGNEEQKYKIRFVLHRFSSSFGTFLIMAYTNKKILVLGSGMVARPCVEYLIRNPKNEVTVACRTLFTAQSMASGLPRTQAVRLDVSSPEDLDSHVAIHDLVISLVPFIFHVAVIKSAIKHRVHVVTTSYVSAAIRELDVAAKEAGIVSLNEVGVDPGVDHLYAIKKIDEVHAIGGKVSFVCSSSRPWRLTLQIKVNEFYSYCGGLPAPECSDNPLRFKFS